MLGEHFRPRTKAHTHHTRHGRPCTPRVGALGVAATALVALNRYFLAIPNSASPNRADESEIHAALDALVDTALVEGGGLPPESFDARYLLTHNTTTAAAAAAAFAPAPAATATATSTTPDALVKRKSSGTVHMIVRDAGSGSSNLLRIAIRLRPDLSESSAAYVAKAADAECSGTMYRVEPSLLLQGRLHPCAPEVVHVVPGDCPYGVVPRVQRRCPTHDPECGCHGPLMIKGMVGWAGGGVGPDFVIYTGDKPAVHWDHDLTVFGEVLAGDAESWAALRELESLRASRHGAAGAMNMIDDKVTLTLAWAHPLPKTKVVFGGRRE